MNRRQQEDLPREVFADEGLDALRERSLADGLAALRAKRRARALRATTLAAAPVLAVALLLARAALKTPPAVSPAAVAAPAISPLLKIYPAARDENAPRVAPISDDELLGLFKGRNVGLVGKAGQEQLVVFGGPPGR